MYQKIENTITFKVFSKYYLELLLSKTKRNIEKKSTKIVKMYLW